MLKYIERFPRYSKKKQNRKILKLRFVEKIVVLKSSKSQTLAVLEIS